MRDNAIHEPASVDSQEQVVNEVDRFVGRPTVKVKTASALAHAPDMPSSRRLPQDPDALVVIYVRGYWLTRYFEETQPGMLKGLLAQRHPHTELEDRIATAYGMERAAFWRDLDKTVAAYFGNVNKE